MTHITRDVEKPGSKLHKKEVGDGGPARAWLPRLPAAFWFCALWCICVYQLRSAAWPALPRGARCMGGAVKMTQTFKLNRTETLC